MPCSISSLSRRRALGASALLATLAMVYRRKALAAGGSLNILNCNVAWSTGLEGLVAEAYEAKTGTSIQKRIGRPYRGHELRRQRRRRAATTSCFWRIYNAA